jgi:hypothetical protein
MSCPPSKRTFRVTLTATALFVGLAGHATAVSDGLSPADALEMGALSLPLIGLLLVLLHWAPALWHSRPARQPPARHVLLLVGAALAVGLLAAGLDAAAVRGGRAPTLQVALASLALAGAVIVIDVRHLGGRVEGAAPAGGAVAAVNLLLLLHWDDLARWGALDDGVAFMRMAFPVLAFALVLAIGAEAYFDREGPRRRRDAGVMGETDGALVVPPPMRRVVEVWAVVLAVAAVLPWLPGLLG